MKSVSASIPAVLAMALAAPSVLGQAASAAADTATAAAQTSSSASSSASSSTSSSLDSRLEAAQRRLEAAQRALEAAARDVAELSAERGQMVMRRYSFVGAPGRAIIGVQLDTASGGGARVLDVSPGGPAAEAGIRAGDVITAVNGTKVQGDDASRQVVRLVRDVKPESKVRIGVSRDGKPREFTVTARRSSGFSFSVGDPDVPMPPAPPAAPAAPAAPAFPGMPFGPGSMPLFIGQGPLADMELATLTPHLGSYFGTDSGVLVIRAPAGGALKLEDGDVIVSIDGRVPTSGPHATRILGSYQPGEKIDLEIVRERKRLHIATTMPEGPRRGRDQFYFRSRGSSASRAPGRVIILRGSSAI